MFICFQQMTIFSPVVAFLLLVSSALVLDVAIYFRRNEKEFKDGFFVICEKEPCGNVEAAGVSITFIALLSPRFQVAGQNTTSPGVGGEYKSEGFLFVL